MKVTFDSAADAAYVCLVDRIGDGEAKRTIAVILDELGAQVQFDIDEGGYIVGIEILDASRLLRLQRMSVERIG